MSASYALHLDKFKERLEREVKKQHVLFVTRDEKKLKTPRGRQQLFGPRAHGYIIVIDREQPNNNILYVKNHNKITNILTNETFQAWSANFFEDKENPPCPKKKDAPYNQFLLSEDLLLSFIKGESKHKPNQSVFSFRTLINKALFTEQKKIPDNNDCKKILKTIATMKIPASENERPELFNGHAAWVVKIKEIAKKLGEHHSNRRIILPKDVLCCSDFYVLLDEIVTKKMKEHSELFEENLDEKKTVFWSSAIKDDKGKSITLSFDEKTSTFGPHSLTNHKLTLEYKNLNQQTIRDLFKSFNKTTEEYARAEEFINRCIERAGETDRYDYFSGERTKINKIYIYLKVISNIYAGKKIDDGFEANEKTILWDSHLFGYWKGRSAKAVHSLFYKTAVQEFDDEKIEVALGIRQRQG